MLAPVFHAQELAGLQGGEGFTLGGDLVRQLLKGLAACFREPNSRGETIGRETMNLHLGEAQPRRGLQ